MFLKGLYSTLNSFALGLWSVNILSLISTKLQVTEMWASVDVIPRVWLSMTGAAYLTLRAHNYYHSSKLDRRRKQLEIEEYEKSIKKN